MSDIGHDERMSPPRTGIGEREMLRTWLEYHRATLLQKCAGLSDEQLAERSCPPSALSLLGLVQHLADVERSWFLRGFVGDQSEGPIYYSDERPDDDFETLAPHGVPAVFEQYTAERDRARRIEAEVASLDEDAARVHPEHGPVSLRWIMVHMIEEYARHNGHADLLRERIDGSTGD